MADLLHINQPLSVWRAGGLAASAFGMRQLTAIRPVLVHTVELEDSVVIGVANDDFAQTLFRIRLV